MKKRLVIANWKMNPDSLADARRLFTKTVRRVSRIRGSQVVICPPALYLAPLSAQYRGGSVRLGAQDVSTQRGTGSFTGELSATQLRDLNVRYVIVGHSERRALGETNEIVAKKIAEALRVGITPIVCVGEQTRDMQGKYLSWLEREIRESFAGIPKKYGSKIIVAYEPIWAIGKSAKEAMSPHELHQMTIFVRKILAKVFGRKHALAMTVLYGGSVEPENDDSLASVGEVDGFLVGHASLEPDAFADIVRSI